MQNDLIKQWTQLSKNANDALKKINTLNTNSIKKLTKLQMDLVSSCLESGIKKTNNVGKVTSVAELMNLQSEIYKELSEKVLLGAQNSVKIAMETKQAMGELIREGMVDTPSLVAKVSVKKTAAKPAAKKVASKKVATKPASKKVAPKKATAKPAAKKVAPKKVATKPAAKKVAPKKAAAKPAAKKIAPKKAAVKPVVKKAVPNKVKEKTTTPKKVAEEPIVSTVKKLQMPKPSGRPMTEGDAKK